MKPKPYVQLQALGTFLVSVIILAVLGAASARAVAITLSLGLSVWSCFAIRYRRFCSHTGKELSSFRTDGDRVMLGCLGLGLLLPAALAWAEALTRLLPFDPPLGGGEATITALAALIIPLSMLVSSSVDWYLIRPFREGVHGPPVCKAEAHRNGRTMDYARYWVLHRMVSEFLVYAGIVALIAIAATIVGQRTHSETGKNVFNLIGLLGILAWTLTELGELRAALDFVRYPSCGLGDWVSGRTDEAEDISGFVLDVSTDPGVQLIERPREHPAPDIALRDRSIPLRHRRQIKAIPPRRPTCPGEHCEFWVPDCELGLRQIESGDRPPDPPSP